MSNKTVSISVSDSTTSGSDVILMDANGHNVLVISFGTDGLEFTGVTDPRWLSLLVEGVMFQQGAAKDIGFVLEVSSDHRLSDICRPHLAVVDASDDVYVATILLSATSVVIELSAEVITAAPGSQGWVSALVSAHDGVHAETGLDLLVSPPRVHSFTVVSPSATHLTSTRH